TIHDGVGEAEASARDLADVLDGLEPPPVAEYQRDDLPVADADARRLVVRCDDEHGAGSPACAQRAELAHELRVEGWRGLWAHAGPGVLPGGAEAVDGELHAGPQPLDGPRQTSDLVGTARLRDGRPQIAAADAVGDLGEPADGPREAAGQRIGHK